ncbi:hypothetical protein ANN_19284 [Periplaneta americana]|uniref:Uncharacterized protein n=1 Tax=Periplaneta americana TaxID=6978 RepID=A0ABQ8S9F5_PERAM|nr:hypothetical protein ANN_19284 [Periplaneta americana]
MFPPLQQKEDFELDFRAQLLKIQPRKPGILKPTDDVSVKCCDSGIEEGIAVSNDRNIQNSEFDNDMFEALKEKIIHDFNALVDWNAHSSHLAGLITVQIISRRRSRKNEDDAEDGRIGDFVVCQKAFLSVHGTTKKRLQTIQRSLKFSGLAPTDGWRKYGNRPHKLSTGTHDKVIEHIKSFKDRSSHYSMEKTSKMYLRETLNVKRL